MQASGDAARQEFKDVYPKNGQGQNLALTFLIVPNSLETGEGLCVQDMYDGEVPLDIIDCLGDAGVRRCRAPSLECRV